MKTKIRDDGTDIGKFLNNGGTVRNAAKAAVIAAVIFAVILTCGCTGNGGGNDKPVNPEIEQSINDLYSADDAVRKAAVNKLILAGDEAIVPLTKVFSSGDKTASMNAAVALYSIGESSIDPLINVLNTGSQTEREWAANTLCLFEARAVPSLINVVKTGSKQGQEIAEIAIIKIGEPALPFLELEANRGTPVTADKMRSLIYSIRATEGLQQRLSEGNTTTPTDATA